MGNCFFLRYQCLIYSTGGPEVTCSLELEALKSLPALCWTCAFGYFLLIDTTEEKRCKEAGVASVSKISLACHCSHGHVPVIVASGG